MDFLWCFFRRGHEGQKLLIPAQNGVIALPKVGIDAAAAILAAVFQIGELPAAAIPQHIERTKAEQAVEVVRVCPLVAGEVFTGTIGEVSVVMVHRKVLDQDGDIVKTVVLIFFRCCNKVRNSKKS